MTKNIIAAHLARPVTHIVTTIYADGTKRTHETRSLAQAENWAVGERRKIGRDLISRETGSAVLVVDVKIEAL